MSSLHVCWTYTYLARPELYTIYIDHTMDVRVRCLHGLESCAHQRCVQILIMIVLANRPSTS